MPRRLAAAQSEQQRTAGAGPRYTFAKQQRDVYTAQRASASASC